MFWYVILSIIKKQLSTASGLVYLLLIYNSTDSPELSPEVFLTSHTCVSKMSYYACFGPHSALGITPGILDVSSN